MTKRFTATELWEEDWFLDLDTEAKLFWFYLKDKCDHAGIWKPNVAIFNSLNGLKIDLDRVLKLINKNKERIQVLPNGRWFIKGFVPFQFGPHPNKNNRVHRSIINLFSINEIRLGSIWGQVEDKDGLKDKDKDKDSTTSKVFISSEKLSTIRRTKTNHFDGCQCPKCR